MKLRSASCFAQGTMANPAKRISAKQDENNPARSVQRRRPRHYHHDYGAGTESAARGGTFRIETTATRAFELCTKLYLHRHLLEQSPSPFPSNRAGQRRNSVGKSVLTVLVVALSFHDGLDW